MNLNKLSEQIKSELRYLQKEMSSDLRTFKKFMGKQWTHLKDEAIMHPYTTLALTALFLLTGLLTQNIVSTAMGLGLTYVFFIKNERKMRIALQEFSPFPKEWIISDREQIKIRAKMEASNLITQVTESLNTLSYLCD